MLPRCAADLDAITMAGRLKAENCRCEEVLWRPPGGKGKYFWVHCQLDGLPSRQAAAALARAAGVDPSVVAWAGNRDRSWQVSQWFSLPMELVEHPKSLRNAGHHKKLRVMELRDGQYPVGPESVSALRWFCRLPGAADGFERGQAIMDRLRRQGVPNYFPGAVVGKGGQLAKWGRLTALGRPLPAAVQRQAPGKGRLLFALQAQLFNRWVAERMERQAFTAALAGDVAMSNCQLKPEKREWAVIDEPETVQSRLDSWELQVYGPLFGSDLIAAESAAAACEQVVIDEADISPKAIARLRGARRALRCQPQKVICDRQGKDLTLTCQLPVDTAITVVLEELVQPQDRRL